MLLYNKKMSIRILFYVILYIFQWTTLGFSVDNSELASIYEEVWQAYSSVR